MHYLCGFAALIGYFILGLAQMLAAMTGLEVALEMDWLPAGMIAFFVGHLPVLGTAAGIAGAALGWQWPWETAVVAFIGPLVTVLALGVAGGALDDLRDATWPRSAI